jgi:hypothetical protein
LIKEVNISATEKADKKLNIIKLNSDDIFFFSFPGSIVFFSNFF